MKIIFCILFSFFVSLVGCQKNNDSNPKIDKQILIGKWVNQSENKDTLYFTDTILYRTNIATNTLSHFYSYELNDDVVNLTYLGMDKVTFIKPFIHALTLNTAKDILTIQNFQNAYPGYNGQIFRRIKM